MPISSSKEMDPFFAVLVVSPEGTIGRLVLRPVNDRFPRRIDIFLVVRPREVVQVDVLVECCVVTGVERMRALTCRWEWKQGWIHSAHQG